MCRHLLPRGKVVGSKLLCVPSDPCFLLEFTLPPSQSSPSDTLRISPWVLKAVTSRRLSLGDRFSRTWFFFQSLGVLGAHRPTGLQLPVSEQLSLFIDRREPWFPGVATERQILYKGLSQEWSACLAAFWGHACTAHRHAYVCILPTEQGRILYHRIFENMYYFQNLLRCVL